MNKKFEPFLANSELTDCIYIIDKDDKYEVTEQCIKAMKATNRLPRWIPVSERLPEDKQAVLVWCPQYKNIYCAYLEKEQWWIFGAFIQIVPNEVVAWMPLPAPYDPQESKEG